MPPCQIGYCVPFVHILALCFRAYFSISTRSIRPFQISAFRYRKKNIFRDSVPLLLALSNFFFPGTVLDSNIPILSDLDGKVLKKKISRDSVPSRSDKIGTFESRTVRDQIFSADEGTGTPNQRLVCVSGNCAQMCSQLSAIH